MRVLIACEFSGIVRDAFAARGHDAWSCDLLPTYRPGGKHIQGDVTKVLNDGWDLMVGHPPCTYLCRASNAWKNRDPGFIENRIEAVEFFKTLWNAPIEKIALENPIGHLSTAVQKPDQIIFAYQFGHIYSKDICLWLKNLPKLEPTMHVPGPHPVLDTSSSNKDRWKIKSTTFRGVAKAMAEQWSANIAFYTPDLRPLRDLVKP